MSELGQDRQNSLQRVRLSLNRARLLVIDPHCWWARTSGGKSPLRRLSPALVAGLFFCGCFRKSETKCPAPSPARLPQSDFRHSNQSLGVTFCSWPAVYAEASVD